jgi:hypothetical protein
MNPLRSRTFVGLALLALAASSPILLAADEGKGSFQFAKTTFKISSAVAYQKDGKDPKKPVTVVIVADFKIDQPALVEAIDPANALIAQVVKNQGGNFAIVTLAPPDRCGVWAFLDTGKQIDLGDTFPARTTAATATRITGECFTSKPEKTLFGDAYEFHLAYDVPLTAIPKASPVPAGGGEPGHALTALIDAIRAGDWDVVHLHLRENELPKTAPKPSERKHFFEGLALNYPKSATVTGGLLKGDQAQLQIDGSTYEGKKVKGDFAMKKVAGNWRVADMSLYGAE